MDMEQDAVQVRPLRQITGESEFNELFIEEARIPDANLLGGEGNGWKVALTTLMNERAGLAFFLQVRLRQMLDRLLAEASDRGLLDDPVIADKLGELHLKAEVLRLTAYRGLTAIEKYGQPGPEGSLTKWMWSETNQQLTQFAADLLGPEALQRGNPWAYELLRARGQHDRRRHHRDPQEHRGRARARAAEGALGGEDMDFDLTEDQKEIKRVAHELLAARSPWAKVRAAAEAGQLRRRALERARRARLAGHRRLRGSRRPGARHDRARGPRRGARVRVRRDAARPARRGGAGDRRRPAAPPQRRALAPGAGVRGDERPDSGRGS